MLIDHSALSIRRIKSVPQSLLSLIPDSVKDHLDPREELILEATWKGTPAGIAVVRMDALSLSGEVEALGVLEYHRHQGIGTALVSALEEELKASKLIVALITYEANAPDCPFLERLLQKRGWQDPQLFMRLYSFDIYAFCPPWYEKTKPIPSAYETFPWQTLTENERDLVEHQARAGTYPISVYPFGDDEKLVEPINSMGLRHQGTLIGWIVTHRIAPDTIRYSHLYIRDDYRHRGISIQLLAKAIRLQQRSSAQFAVFELRISRVEKHWRRFVERRLAPYAQNTSNKLMSWKDLRLFRDLGCETCG